MKLFCDNCGQRHDVSPRDLETLVYGLQANLQDTLNGAFSVDIEGTPYASPCLLESIGVFGDQEMYGEHIGSLREAQRKSYTRVHVLKTDREQYENLCQGLKHFDLRPCDRDYQVGDVLRFMVFDRSQQAWERDETFRSILFILPGGQYGLPETHCILGLDPNDDIFHLSELDYDDELKTVEPPLALPLEEQS